MNTTKRARFSLILSMASFGTLAPFVRNINVSSGELALYRAILASLLIGCFLLVTKQTSGFRRLGKELYLLLFSGVAMGFNWILLFEAYKYTTVAIATLSYYFAPVIVTLVCPLLFHEKLTKKQILCFVMSTFGLGAAVLYATVVLLNKFITGVTGIHRTFLQFVAAVTVLTPYVLFTSGFHLGNLDLMGWGCLLIVGFVHTGITYCLYFTSLKELSGQEAAILSYVDPLVAVVIGVLLLKEPLSWQQLVGGLLILGFTLLNELDTK